MVAQIINGKEISKKTRSELREEVVNFIEETGVTPHLTVVLVGENPASQSYVRGKQRACLEVGIKSTLINLDENTPENELLEVVENLNKDKDVHGILVQLPLPKSIDEKKVVNLISPDKDVDGFLPENIGNMLIGEDNFLPCTPAGVIKMLKESNINIEGKHAVVVGRSNIVGKPVSQLLLRENATVTTCHRYSGDLSQYTKQADILVVAVGKPNLITEDMVKENVVIVDVGVNRLDNGKLVGDVDFENVKNKASYITPVPGGVGPMTITMLLVNTLKAARAIIRKSA